MKCPICGKRLPIYGERCTDCGYRVPDCEDYDSSVQPGSDDFPILENAIPYYEPPNKTSRSKGCCCAALMIVPLLLLLIGAVIFGIQFVKNEIITEDFGLYEDAPFFEVPDSLPAEAVENAFSIRNGEITFLPHKWDGGRVLQVPGTVDGQTVTGLAPGCFVGCAELTTIILPNTITQIGQEAFAGCTGLRGLLIPVGTVTIRADAFAGCVSLEALYVPDSVNFFSHGCLDDCASLMYIFYDGTFEGWSEVYSDFVTPFTIAICTDGSFYHGARS